MNVWDTDYLLFHINLWEMLGAMVVLQSAIWIYVSKGTKWKKNEQEKIGITPDGRESETFSGMLGVFMGMGGFLSGMFGLFYVLTSGMAIKDGEPQIVMSFLLGVSIVSVLCLALAYGRYRSKELLLEETFDPQFIRTIAKSVDWERIHHITHRQIRNLEQARLLAEGIPVVEKYHSLLERQRTFSRKAQTERQHQLLEELDEFVREKKVEVQQLFPLIFGTLEMENPLQASEKAWQDVEKELEKAKSAL